MTRSSLKKFTRELSLLLPSVMRGVLKRQPSEFTPQVLTVPQYLLLDLMASRGPMTMTEISLEMGVSLPAMTGMVARLHTLKMVERAYDRKDRRIIRIVTTDKARKAILKIRRGREKMVQRVFGKLSEHERQSYLKILNKVHDVLYGKSL
ncbi:MAG: MarR family transcriptional regulator [Candidatus Omnitrophota bacterium]